jgi:hypothetical protein
MRACIAALAVYARVRQVEWGKTTWPVDAVICRLRCSAVSVQAMNYHHARAGLTVDRAMGQQGHILNHRVNALRYHLQALCNCSDRFCSGRECRGF